MPPAPSVLRTLREQPLLSLALLGRAAPVPPVPSVPPVPPLPPTRPSRTPEPPPSGLLEPSLLLPSARPPSPAAVPPQPMCARETTTRSTYRFIIGCAFCGSIQAEEPLLQLYRDESHWQL